MFRPGGWIRESKRGLLDLPVRRGQPALVLAHVFEVLDLTLAGWEFARVRVDADYAGLAERLISTARDLRDAMGEPPPLPPPVRELMRRNNTIDVYAASHQLTS